MSASHTNSENSPSDSTDPTGPEIDGWKLVLVMLTFGILASGTLWGYWYYHTAPFIPLQVAIAEEFPGSAPRVDGGQRKMHKGTESLLWIIMRVDFKPQEDPQKAEQTVARVRKLATEHLDLSPYEQLTVRLFFGEMEKEIHRLDFDFPLGG